MALTKLSDDALDNVSGGTSVGGDGFPEVNHYCPYCNTVHQVKELSGGRYLCTEKNETFDGTSVSGNAVARGSIVKSNTVAKGPGGKIMSGSFSSDVLC
jgi:hypothetical protein